MSHIFLKFLIAVTLALPAIAIAQETHNGAVTGKSGMMETATPITNLATVNETTAGYQTEAGAIQERGISVSSSLPSGKQNPKAIGPLHPEQAGQSPTQADINAQAATRAELYPGTTLGVDLQSAPPSPQETVAIAQKHLERNTQKKPRK